MTWKGEIIGAGMTRFGKFPEQTISDLAQPAVLSALQDAGVSPRDIQAAYCGSVYSGMAPGQRILRDLGMTGIPIHNVENACSSGSTALREALLSIEAGAYETVLVFGVEQLSRFGGGAVPLNHDDREVAQGMMMPALYAMRAQRHMVDFGTTIEQLARVSVKNRRNGCRNPSAQFQKECSLDQVLNSRPVADPLTLFHCCPTGDGAAALVLTSRSRSDRFKGRPIKVLASVLTSGFYKTGFRDMSRSELTIRAAKEAYEQASLGPEDIDLAEVHDAFTIAEILYYEALGFCEAGEGGRFIDSGASEIGGSLPVNPSGGLLARGHPLGATGVAQVVEAYGQLLGRCGDRQVAGANTAVTHCTGGGISGLDHVACTIHIFSN
jgi:benzoylsuccinyl-CoA thiolase BbsB subunit